MSERGKNIFSDPQTKEAAEIVREYRLFNHLGVWGHTDSEATLLFIQQQYLNHHAQDYKLNLEGHSSPSVRLVKAIHCLPCLQYCFVTTNLKSQKSFEVSKVEIDSRIRDFIISNPDTDQERKSDRLRRAATDLFQQATFWPCSNFPRLSEDKLKIWSARWKLPEKNK